MDGRPGNGRGTFALLGGAVAVATVGATATAAVTVTASPAAAADPTWKIMRT